MPTRKFRKSRRGGNYSFSSLGQAASNLLVPAGLFYAAKRRQGRRSIRKVLKRR
jgi:hypothetical protein